MALFRTFVICIRGEIALLSGVVPNKTWGPNLRFSIAALGQMATPIQSLWIVSQFKQHLLQSFLDLPVPKPEEVLWNHIGDIMRAYEKIFPTGFQHESVQCFLDRTHQCLLSHANKGLLPPNQVGLDQTEECAPEIRKFCTPDHASVPASVPLGFEETHQSSEQAEVASGCFCAPAPVGEASSSKHESWECDYPNCPVCLNDALLPPIPKFCDEPFPHETSPIQISPTVPFRVEATTERDLGAHDTPRVKPFPVSGGIPAFSSRKRAVDPSWTTSPVKKAFVELDLPHDSLRKSAETHNTADGVADTTHGAQSFELHCESPLSKHTRVDHSAETFPVGEVSEVAQPVLQCGRVSSCEVHLFRHDLGMLQPQTITVRKGSTVGELHVAEDSLQSFSMHSRMCDGVGAFVSDTCTIDRDIELHVHLLRDDCGFWKCPFHTGSSVSFLGLAPMTRLDFLDFQQGWMAKDEMDFYLETLCDSPSVATFFSFTLPDIWDTFDADLFIQWFITGIKSKSGCDYAVSTVLWKNHWIPLAFAHADIGVNVHTSPEGQSLLEFSPRTSLRFQSLEPYTGSPCC